MKKGLFLLLATLVLAVGCHKELESSEIGSTGIGSKSFYAEIEQPGDTKTYIDDNLNVRFQKGDQIAVFYNNTFAEKYQIEDSADGETSGLFNKVENIPDGALGGGGNINAIVAYYPYAALKIDATSAEKGNYVLKGITLPATQTYDTAHLVAQNTLPMLSAKTDNDRVIQFKNICGVLKLNVKGHGSIRKISFKGNNGEKVSGVATVSLRPDNMPLIAMDNSAKSEVVLDCGENGAVLDPEIPRAFMIMLPPMKLEKGFEITLTDLEGASMVKKTTTPKEIKRSMILNMKEAFTFGQKPVPPTPGESIPNNQIWYTTTDDAIIKPVNTTAACFGANLTENVYENGKGIMTFAGDVTKIGKNAFSSIVSLTSVCLPDNVTEIQDQSFYGCSVLSEVRFPKQLQKIGIMAFYNCGLNNVVLPEKLKTIEWNAFVFCSHLKSVVLPEGLQSIGEGAFMWCDSLATINIPDSVTEYGEALFAGCTGLHTVDCANVTQDGQFLIKDHVLIHAFPTEKVVIDIPADVRRIGNQAFRSFIKIRSVYIPDNVIEIGDYSFCWCESLAGIELPHNLVSIGAAAFSNCLSFTEIVIPESVRSIGCDVLRDCSKLNSIYCRSTIAPELVPGLNNYDEFFNGEAPGRKIYVPNESLNRYKTAQYWNKYADDIVGYDFPAEDVDSPLMIVANGVKIPMIWVNGGSFNIGATSEQSSDAYSNENPVHNVTLSGYYIGQTQVTQEIWEAVMGSNPSSHKGNPLYPVEQVSWNDIVNDFLPKLNALTGKTFVLPTEAQWEYAARGGNKSMHYKYSGSNNIDEVAWYSMNSGDQTHPVAQKLPNELGLYDMSGNVYEWCSDWYGIYGSMHQTDPTGPASSSDPGSHRIIRGAGSGYDARECRVSNRLANSPDCRHFSYGFRLVIKK